MRQLALLITWFVCFGTLNGAHAQPSNYRLTPVEIQQYNAQLAEIMTAELRSTFEGLSEYSDIELRNSFLSQLARVAPAMGDIGISLDTLDRARQGEVQLTSDEMKMLLEKVNNYFERLYSSLRNHNPERNRLLLPVFAAKAEKKIDRALTGVQLSAVAIAGAIVFYKTGDPEFANVYLTLATLGLLKAGTFVSSAWTNISHLSFLRRAQATAGNQVFLSKGLIDAYHLGVIGHAYSQRLPVVPSCSNTHLL